MFVNLKASENGIDIVPFYGHKLLNTLDKCVTLIVFILYRYSIVLKHIHILNLIDRSVQLYFFFFLNCLLSSGDTIEHCKWCNRSCCC